MARPIVRHVLATLAALALAACGSSTLSSLRLDITADKPQYTAGSPVMLTIRNLGDQPVLYSFCAAEIQRRTATGWVSAGAQFVSCMPPVQSIAPGASATEPVELPPNLAAGTYRVYLPLVGDPGEDAASADVRSRKSSRPFTVTAG